MSRTLSGIRQTVRQFLSDEFAEGSSQDFLDDELDLHIGECLAEISERRPYEVKESLTTAASYDLDISSIEDLLEVVRAEFPVASDPPDFRNVSVFGTTLTIDIETKPTAGETIYLFCHELHQLTEESSTLAPQLETLLIAGSVAKAALGWTNQIRKQVTEALTRIADVHTAIGNMSDRVEQSIADLSTGRPLIDESREKAETVIDDVETRIAQATSDLAEGRDLGFNKIYVGGNPLGDYSNYAARELSNANTSLAQARGYLSVDAPAGQYGNYASRELSNANAYLNQAGGFTRELTSRLSITGVINSYQTWANNKLTVYLRDLKRLSKPKTYRTYPRD